MPYTSAKGFSVQTSGSNAGTWGTDSSTPTAGTSDALNEGVIELLDQALAGVTSLTLSSSNVALSQIQAQKGMLRLSGTLTANVVISPDTSVLWLGIYCVENLTSGSFTVTLQNAGGSVVIPQSRRALVFISTANGPRIIGIAGSSSGDPIPVGTVMLFYQNAAPTGWTISSSLNDYALKIVSSSGGVTSGSVAYSTLFGRTATDSHTLTTDEIPSHTHTFTYVNSAIAANNSTSPVSSIQTSGGTTTVTTSTTGGGSGHTHDIDMRVQTASVILATKD